jgi:hypothetical protein
MGDAVPVVVAVGGVLAGLGGLVAALYYGDRLMERRRERGPVSVELISYGDASCIRPDSVMFHVEVRLYNPKAVPCSITKLCLSHKMGGYILRPVGEGAYGDYRFKGDTPIELPPKRHSELELGFPFKKEATHGETVCEEFHLDVDFDDGSHVRSKPFKWPVDLRKAR